MDAQHFRDVWLMNEEEAKGLIRRALNADRVIHAQQLGLQWDEPDSWVLRNVGPFMYQKKMKSASQLARDVLTPECKPGFLPVSSHGGGVYSVLEATHTGHTHSTSRRSWAHWNSFHQFASCLHQFFCFHNCKTLGYLWQKREWWREV